ncbi:hypothetical protein [Nocardia sp. NPDC051981]|uniref:hypothetical protein n=1 Tax=Nocardia sp. NPDC051981 TaxID=3155417 RepID=UPI003414A3E1
MSRFRERRNERQQSYHCLLQQTSPLNHQRSGSAAITEVARLHWTSHSTSRNRYVQQNDQVRGRHRYCPAVGRYRSSGSFGRDAKFDIDCGYSR